jgi:hypothetical protein
MEWLLQNWIWLALAAGAFWLLSRGRRGGPMGGCCGGHAARDGPAGDGNAQEMDAARPGK